MKKFLLAIIAVSVTATGFAQSVGIGTTTPAAASRLHIVSDNQATSLGLLIDGNELGTALQITRGGTGIGPFAPGNKLFVATAPDTSAEVDKSAAIIGYSQNILSANQGGILGLYDPGLFGVGVQGLGYSGISFENAFGGEADAGLYGSASIGVAGIGDIIGLYAEAADLGDTPPDEQYGILATASAGTAATKYAGYFDGDVYISGDLAKASGTFKIDDPIDPANKYLYHSFVESPDMMNIYNGNVTTGADGMARVTLPEYFDALNKEFRYQLTAIGTFAQAIVKEEINGNYFLIQTSEPNVKVSWQVTGVRKDKFAEAHRVEVEVEKEPWNKGLYLHAKEFGMDNTKSIPYQATLKRGSAASPLQSRKFTTTKRSTPAVSPMMKKLLSLAPGE